MGMGVTGLSTLLIVSPIWSHIHSSHSILPLSFTLSLDVSQPSPGVGCGSVICSSEGVHCASRIPLSPSCGICTVVVSMWLTMELENSCLIAR